MKKERIKKNFLKCIDGFFLLRLPLHVPVWTILLLGWITGNTRIPAGGIFSGDYPLAQEKTLWIALGSFSLIAAFIYVVNQIIDIEGDRINHKLFILPNGLLSVKTAWTSALCCAALGILLSILFLDYIMTIIFTASILLGILYNLPPFSLKNKAWGSVWANFFGHGVATYLVGWYAAFMHAPAPSGAWLDCVWGACAIGFAEAAVFLTTTIPDSAGDRMTGKRTFSIVYGVKGTAWAAVLLCLLALVFSFFITINRWIMIVQSLVGLVFFLRLAFSTSQEFAFKTFRWPVVILSVLVALYVPLYGLLLLTTFASSRLYYKMRFNYEYPTFKSK